MFKWMSMEKRTRTLSVRLSDAEFYTLLAAMARNGTRSIGEFARRIIVSEGLSIPDPASANSVPAAIAPVSSSLSAELRELRSHLEERVAALEKRFEEIEAGVIYSPSKPSLEPSELDDMSDSSLMGLA